MKIINVILKLLVLNNKEEGYFCPMKMYTFVNLNLHVFCWSKLANPFIYTVNFFYFLRNIVNFFNIRKVNY